VPPQDDPAAAGRVADRLLQLVRLLERAHAQYLAAHPGALERATYLLLVHLATDGPCRARCHSGAVHSDPSTVSRQVAQLVRLGLVERTADPGDGRATLLAATEEGHRAFAENRHRRNELPAATMAGRPPADRDRFAELLGRFATDFEDHRTRATRPDTPQRTGAADPARP
jgi:DNA-binding MarR family transcriptional regulator